MANSYTLLADLRTDALTLPRFVSSNLVGEVKGIKTIFNDGGDNHPGNDMSGAGAVKTNQPEYMMV
ncbi:hypothetical protein Bca4012_003161 [Brassica carinata]|uniref:Uncharacterized protein n=1 Tax=Brassica carinata TaxID=52824 RepID=A0A8X7RUJ5_BRACI|nr:hypothetical protein Bca52824_042098 [Brassica carinata]